MKKLLNRNIILILIAALAVIAAIVIRGAEPQDACEEAEMEFEPLDP